MEKINKEKLKKIIEDIEKLSQLELEAIKKIIYAKTNYFKQIDIVLNDEPKIELD
jgi:hypothetical protein